MRSLEKVECAVDTTTLSSLRKSSPSLLEQILCAVDLCEMYSAGKRSRQVRHEGGGRDGSTTEWDYNRPDDRRSAEEYVDREMPLVLIGSPPCVAFRNSHVLILESERKSQQLSEGVRRMEFVVNLYRKQAEGGRLLFQGNLARAKSWALPCIWKMMRQLGVDAVETHQYMFGLTPLPTGAGQEPDQTHDPVQVDRE